MIVKYRIRTVRFEGEIEVQGDWVIKAPEECKWMKYKSLWYIKSEIERHEGIIEEVR